jgi:tetratricopeptide (TPR) repeat protein
MYDAEIQKLCDEADRAIQNTEYDTAIKLYLDALELSKKELEENVIDTTWLDKLWFMACNGMGISYAKLGHIDDAIENFQDALVFAPNEEAKQVAQSNIDKYKQAIEEKEDEETMWLYMKSGECKHIKVKKSDILKSKKFKEKTTMKNLYLDVDGVILLDDLENNGRNALSLPLFLSTIGDLQADGLLKIHWLTTHCKEGTDTQVMKYLKSSRMEEYPLDLIERLKIQPTVWSKHKTDAIDFSQDFFWLDDDASLQEREILRNHNAEHKLIEINLQKNKYQLKDIVYSGVLGNTPSKMPWLSGKP